MAASKGSSIDAATVAKVAGLANLRLSSSEISYYQNQLERVLGYISELSSLDSDRVKLSSDQSFSFLSPPRERDDIRKPSLEPELALKNAATSAGTAFQVPRVID